MSFIRFLKFLVGEMMKKKYLREDNYRIGLDPTVFFFFKKISKVGFTLYWFDDMHVIQIYIKFIINLIQDKLS